MPVFPAQPYGFTPTYMAYPGTMTLRLQTLLSVLSDLVETLSATPLLAVAGQALDLCDSDNSGHNGVEDRLQQ